MMMKRKNLPKVNKQNIYAVSIYHLDTKNSSIENALIIILAHLSKACSR